MVMQVLIALDQLANTFIDGGYADETISARAWRSQHNPKWAVWRIRIDSAALYFFNQKDHCYLSYVSERKRTQMPPEYRA